MNMRKTTQMVAGVGGRAIFALSVLASCASFGYEEPVYAVTVAEGTNSLDEATVEVTQNGETTSAAFSSLTLNEGGTFVKKGLGWLQSSTAMSVFTGEVVVEERSLLSAGSSSLRPARSWTSRISTISSMANTSWSRQRTASKGRCRSAQKARPQSAGTWRRERRRTEAPLFR